jgi:hypothetical protein
MRIRIDSLSLVGGDRVFRFGPGLNIITGPITSGKTTLLRLCRVALGTTIDRMPREVTDTVTALGVALTIGDVAYSVVRPLVTTPTAKVDVAGSDGSVLRVPAQRPDATSPLTFSQWMLERLGLPRLQVPSAPTKPDSDPSPVTVSDYLLYCTLPQGEIDSSVFGHTDAFKDIKRKYVFQILYGYYDVETAEPPRVCWRLRLLGNRSCCRRQPIVVDRFVLRRRDHPELTVQAAVVEPVDVVEGGVLDVLKPSPRTLVSDQLRLVEPIEGFGQGVIVAIAPRPHRGDRAGLGQALGVANRDVLHAAIGMVNQPR